MKNSFKNPLLQEIDSEANSVIANHLQDLDRVSNDIKALEERLKTAAVPFTFIYVLSTEKKEGKRWSSYSRNPIEDDTPYEATFLKCTDKCLIWGKNGEGEPRLYYNVYDTEDEWEWYYNGEKDYRQRNRIDGNPRLVLCIPVIETKSYLRIKTERELSNFYKLVIAGLKNKKAERCVIEYSENYNQEFPAAIDERQDALDL